MEHFDFDCKLRFFGILIAAYLMTFTVSPSSAANSRANISFQKPASGEIVPAPSELRDLIERWSADQRSLDRFYVFPFSSRHLSRFMEFHQEYLGILDGIDYRALSIDGKIDYLLFKNHLNRALLKLEQDAETAEAALSLLPFAETVITFREDLQRMQWIDAERAAETLSGLRHQIEEARQSAQKKGLSAIREAVSMLAALRSGLKEWFDFYNGYDPKFTWWAAEAYESADEALKSYAETLRKDITGQSGAGGYAIKEPVGRDVLLRELAFEYIPYSPEEILAIGWQELAWCEKERLAASRELGYGDNWQAAMEHVKKKYVGPGEQPELIRFLTYEAIEFLEEHDSLTIPPMVKELLRMRMMPLERQRTTPFFTGGEVISVAYPTAAVPYDQKIQVMRGNNPHFSRAVVHHELVPGHNLQGFMAARHRSYRRPFSTSFFGEGWPLYWEMRLWDMDFQRSPEDRIGMLFWRMHRCARIIFSMSYQLGRMSVEECVDLLVDRIGHERQQAEAEAKAHLSGRAYGGRPLAQISYLIGGLQMRALSRELVDSGKMTAKAFHDAVLREGSIPIELLRAKMIDQDLDPDFTSRWKFYSITEDVK